MKLSFIYGILFITLFSVRGYSEGFYDINTINKIEITFEQSNWDNLLDNLAAAGDEERLIGKVTINGMNYDSVGIRYKGNSTYRANQVKNPLNIKLDHIINDQEIEGFGTLKLANVFKDPSFIREVLGYEIARKYMPASYSNFAKVYINGTYLGLYTNDQDVDKFFMRSNFGSDENARIKGEISGGFGPPTGTVWAYNGADTNNYSNYFALESDYGWQDLVWFLDTLNNKTEVVDKVLNVDRHLWFLAFSNLLVNLDGPINNPQNHYIYKDDNGRMNPIPWDLNECFGVFTSHQTLGNLNTSGLQQMSPFANLNANNFPIISKILSNEKYKKMYVAHMKTIIEENFSNKQYEARALEIQDIIKEEVQADPNKFYTYANFTSNIYNQIGGGGPGGSAIGIVQLMEARSNYILNLNEFKAEAPSISEVSHSPEKVSQNSDIMFTATVSNESEVYLAYRTKNNGIFEKILMFDDGQHNDGLADDGVYGISIKAASTDIQYYIYAENTDAVSFSPVRAEYEFYNIKITGNLVINEFMADNDSFITDQDGDYDDWIELYNNSDQAINLSAYFLSDKGDDPYQWTFPNVTIEAGGYLIIWADNDEEQDGLHANFKLSASGETILLTNSDKELVDQVTFLQQSVDKSTGRIPNGTGDFVDMEPTFESMNINSTTSVRSQIENSIVANIYPNPAKDEFVISSEQTIQKVIIYDALGINLFEKIINNNKAVINTTNFNNGMYIVKIETQDGNSISSKLNIVR